MRPMPFSTVALKMTGMASAYSGCRQKGQAYGQSVRFSAAGTTDARGSYFARMSCERMLQPGLVPPSPAHRLFQQTGG